ncbi:RnfABCDGE type electron transport complex subunit G [Halothiobacillus sp.]|uniref:RnfABCDGE type electron transport complex subunit G n=1 Tax=Halothiobacillus sp. TaxID=1891311 RepID=UPI002625B1A9|nr:RnfABCDGE type electron transport complex subunit G [Halothiobacillus sp.]
MKRLLTLDKSRIIITALLLGGFSVVGVGLVSVTQEATRERIAQGELAVLRGQVTAVLRPGSFDNNPADTAFLPPDPEALNLPPLKPEPSDPVERLSASVRAGIVGFRAMKEGKVTAVVLPVITPYGYSGDIKLIVGVDREGEITGVRVTKHNETPGLGDKIETAKGRWIFGFEGKSLDDPGEKGWAVKKDGGVFDQFSGATITPRAVVGAIHQVLEYVRLHHDELFDAPHSSRHEHDDESKDKPEAAHIPTEVNHE